MIVAVALFELHIEHAQSLKEKRAVVKSLRERLRNHFHIAVNEVAFQDLHQRARLAIAFIADANNSADSLLDTIQRFVETNTDAVVTGWTAEKLDFDEEAAL
ncbi:MAG TPA: DUF503 domain-containing protein [Thermoanaerobaculia bacterium]